MTAICPLCKHTEFLPIDAVYMACAYCGGLICDRALALSAEDEQAFYETHENDIHDAGYRTFVQPITDYVLTHFSAHHEGLDFGSGTGPVITQVLRESGYTIQTYDPFFDFQPKRLDAKYDYIVCCEVMEHFHEPAMEFKQLNAMLKPGGKLICMTYLYASHIDFATWRYRRDPTHTFIYTAQTIDVISRMFNFKSHVLKGRLIVFSV